MQNTSIALESREQPRTRNGRVPAESNLSLWLCGFALFIGSLLLTGYHIYSGNQGMQLPIVLQQNDPSLYKNDPFVSTLRFYASGFWKALAVGNRVLPLEPLLLGLFLLERLVSIYAAGRLAHAFTRGSKAAVVGAMAMFALAPDPIIGGGTITVSYVEQTGLSIPFFLLAMAAFYQRRRFWWAVWFAVGFNLNIMYGVFALAYFLPVFLFDFRYRSEWNRWLFPGLLVAVLVWPTLLLAASALQRTTTDVNLWLAASRVRLPHHLYPLAWPKRSLLEFGIFLVVVLVLLYQNRQQHKQLFLHGIIWTSVSVGFLIAAFITAYLIRSPSLLIMQPARGSDLWYCFAGIALISLLADRLTVEEDNKPLDAVAFLASVFYWHPLSGSLILLGLMALMWAPARKWGLGEGRPYRVAVFVVLAVLMTASYSLQVRARSHKDGAFRISPTAPMREVADWARKTAPLEAIFLTNPTWDDPEWDQFRVLSRRAVFVTFRDGGAIQWDRAYVTEWATRLAALGFDLHHADEDLSSLYDRLDDKTVQRIKRQYRIDFWMVAAKHRSSFPIIFQNQQYAVLDVRAELASAE